MILSAGISSESDIEFPPYHFMIFQIQSRCLKPFLRRVESDAVPLGTSLGTCLMYGFFGFLKRKRLRFATFLALIPALHSASSEGDGQIITLKDTSIIYAKVIDDTGGFFVIKSPALGEVKIRTNEIQSIKPTNPQSAILPTTALSSGPADIILAEKSDADNSEVKQLANNPDLVKAVLGDPNMMKAIQKGDIATLRGSPVVRQLLSDPQTKSLIKSLLNK